MLEKYLNNEKPISSYKLKNKLIEKNLLKNQCQTCGIKDWCDKPISLHLHHIDGNNKNNNLSNLAILCPNCHSQTNNYSGRNKQRSKRTIVSDEQIIEAIKTTYNRRQALLKLGLTGYGGSYERINQIIKKFQIEFLVCNSRLSLMDSRLEEYRKQKELTIINKYKSWENVFSARINWPNKEELEQKLKKFPCCQIAKELGVSDKAVRKKAIKYGINIKEISKWARKHGR